MNELNVKEILTDGVTYGIKNFVSLLITVVLFALTIWIPYLNVGTIIAMSALPAKLAKGELLNPLYIFEAKYRRNMGEYFIMSGLMFGAYVLGTFLGIIPAIVMSYAWMFAGTLFAAEGLSPMEAIRCSNEKTYGHKLHIFFIFGLLAVVYLIAYFILGGIAGLISDSLAVFVNIVLMMLVEPILISCKAVIYRQLFLVEENA